jgi:F0F1-type ATP synthase assembly protein I
MKDESGGDNFSSMSAMYAWSARTSAIAMEMVVPAIAGFGIDQLCGTVAIFTIIGTILGIGLGFWQLIRLAASDK